MENGDLKSLKSGKIKSVLFSSIGFYFDLRCILVLHIFGFRRFMKLGPYRTRQRNPELVQYCLPLLVWQT